VAFVEAAVQAWMTKPVLLVREEEQHLMKKGKILLEELQLSEMATEEPVVWMATSIEKSLGWW
jgi:hypothetical protein